MDREDPRLLTLYTWPKSFDDPHIATIQRNAVRSWLLLRPRPVICVFGDAPGTAEYCAEFGLNHVTARLASIDGTARIRDMAALAEAASDTRCYCFVNADILLTGSLMEAIRVLCARCDRFLLGASPWNLDVREELSFAPGWEAELERRARERNDLRPVNSSDLFLYPKGFLANAPELVVGRFYIDTGLMGFARRSGAALIDGSPGILTVHQNHHYAHLGKREFDPAASAGALWNLDAIGGRKYLFTWRNATHHYTRQGLRPYWAGRLCFWSTHHRSGTWLSRRFISLIYTPLARATSVLRKPLGLTNPRH
jgi:hypothetical protein